MRQCGHVPCLVCVHACARRPSGPRGGSRSPLALCALTPRRMRALPGVPTKIAWKPFYSNLPPPALRGPGGFGDLPPLKKNMKVVQRDTSGGMQMASATKSAAADGPSDEDVEYWFKIMQEKMTTRFSELRRAFRTLDEDASGSLDREEFKQVLVMFNLGIPDRVMNKLIDLADFDGDGSINYAEFARIFTAENINNLKQTLQVRGVDSAFACLARLCLQLWRDWHRSPPVHAEAGP